MTYRSQLLPGEQVIDEHNSDRVVAETEAAGLCRGYEPRDWSLSAGVGKPLDIPLIPRSEWAGLIEEREHRGQLLSQVMLKAGVPSLDQGRTNYCWCNAVVTGMLAIRAANGLPYVPLSPASAAARIKRFQNVGGWGSEALDFVTENGVLPASVWPANEINPRLDTPTNRTTAKKYRIQESYDLNRYGDRQGQRFERLMTCLILGWPAPGGFLWWGHEVCCIDPVVLGRDSFGVRIRNSWGNTYGSQGFAVLDESRATPDDAVAIRSVAAI